MKTFIVYCSFFFLYFNLAVAQTNANIAGPENVLVVFNSSDQTSVDVKNYYQSVRGIPAINICELDALIPHDINVDGTTHQVIIADGGNIIQDVIGNSGNSWFVTQHAWKYFYQYVALPIKNYIISNCNASREKLHLIKNI